MSGLAGADRLRVLACQLHIPPTPDARCRDRHLHHAARRVDAALSGAAVDVVVLPELSSIDYSRESFVQLEQLAEPLLGPSFECWSAVAQRHRCTLAYSFARRDERGCFYISVALVAPNGRLLGHYDKLHLAQFGASMEKEYFCAGEQLLVLDVQGFRLAPIICFDIRPPELCRRLALEHRVDVILHMGAYYRDPSFASWHAFAQTRAVENHLYLLSLNRAGEHYGDSLLVPPWVDEHHRPSRFPRHEEAMLRFELRREAIDTARRDFAFLAERLPSYQLPCATVHVSESGVRSSEPTR